MNHIFIFNIILGISTVTFLLYCLKLHVTTYWEKNYYFLPIFTFIIKFVFVIYFYLASVDGGLHDAHTFYYKPVDYYPFKLGNHVVLNLGYFIRSELYISYFNANLLLSILSFVGLHFLLMCASSYYKKKKIDYYFVIFFFPSIHFWSIGFAKETFVFFSMSLLCYKIFQQQRISILYLIIILLPVILVRPHYTIFFVFAAFLYNLLISNKKKKDLLILTSFLFLGLYLLIMSLELHTTGSLFNLNLDDLKKFIAIRQNENPSQTMEFEFREYNILELTLRFIYFPNILDIFKVEMISTQFLLLVENTILLLLTIKIVKRIFKIKDSKITKSSYILICFIILFALSASLITANLGIVFRYKNLIYPIFIIMLFLVYKKKKKRNETYLKFTETN